MISVLKLLILWAMGGLLFGIVFAILGVGAGGASVIFIPVFFIIGIIFCTFHCIIYFVIGKNRNIFQFLPLSLIILYFVGFQINEYIKESNCNISEQESMIIALTFASNNGLDLKYLERHAQKLSGCRLGFTYDSPDRYKAVIVNSDGSAELNH
ncbi:MAG: hypothetical protein HRU38_14200 [Saccharospirillaceae bacterium]|nr:hypothetical protein [Pseudomonadales bacterium]NRB79795.1 hypothetical protein [Saccharospirillaceae bacterium]